jgi:hypothetical protein
LTASSHEPERGGRHEAGSAARTGGWFFGNGDIPHFRNFALHLAEGGVMTTYTRQRAHLVACNAIGETQRLTSSIKAMAKIIDLVPQPDRAELIKALDKLAQAVAQLTFSNFGEHGSDEQMFGAK